MLIPLFGILLTKNWKRARKGESMPKQITSSESMALALSKAHDDADEKIENLISLYAALVKGEVYEVPKEKVPEAKRKCLQEMQEWFVIRKDLQNNINKVTPY